MSVNELKSSQEGRAKTKRLKLDVSITGPPEPSLPVPALAPELHVSSASGVIVDFTGRIGLHVRLQDTYYSQQKGGDSLQSVALDVAKKHVHRD